MVDYLKSLQMGLEASQEAERNNAEINTVFRKFKDAVSEGTGGAATVKVVSLTEKDNSYIDALSLAYSSLKRGPRSYTAIVVCDRDGKDAIEIARWKVGESGYPVSVGSDSGQNSCHDKESLERSLSMLLQQPSVGSAFSQFMKKQNQMQ